MKEMTKIVPLVATNEMKQSALEANRNRERQNFMPILPKNHEIWASEQVWNAMLAAAPSPAEPGGFAEDDAKKKFEEYMHANYHDGVILSKIGWHIPKIWRAAMYAIKSSALLAAQVAEPAIDWEYLARGLLKDLESTYDNVKNGNAVISIGQWSRLAHAKELIASAQDKSAEQRPAYPNEHWRSDSTPPAQSEGERLADERDDWKTISEQLAARVCELTNERDTWKTLANNAEVALRASAGRG